MILSSKKSLLFCVGLSLTLMSFKKEEPVLKNNDNPKGVMLAPRDVFVVDKKESALTWKGSHLFKFNEHGGKVKLSDGSLTAENGVLTKGTFTVDMNTIVDNDNVDDLINHLKSEDFFNVKKYPNALFVITTATPLKDAGPGENNYEIKGNLTIKGVTKPVTFKAKVNITAGMIKATGRTIIDRTQWNVKYNSGKFFSSLGDEAISDAIQIEIDITARK